MITKRPSAERGHFDHGWLDTRHTFSFARYHDSRYDGFRNLLVINEDRVQPSRGFGAHSHEDMEIISYVVAGTLQHRDSLGTGSIIRPGEGLQVIEGAIDLNGVRLTAGDGAAVSEEEELRIRAEADSHFLLFDLA